MSEPHPCPLCSLRTSQPKHFVSHLRKNHPHAKDVGVDCIACDDSFTSVAGFLNHWYKKHHVRTLRPKPTSTASDPGQESLAGPPATTSDMDSHPHLSSSSTNTPCEEEMKESEVTESLCQVQSTSGGPSNLCYEEEMHELGEVSESFHEVDDHKESGGVSNVLGEEDENDNSDESENSDNDCDSISHKQLNVGACASHASNISDVKDVSSEPDLSELAGMYVLTLKSQTGTTEESLKSVLKSTRNLIQETMRNCLSEMKEQKVSLESPSLKKFIEEKSDIFGHVNSKDKQKKFFKEKFDLLSSTTIPVVSEFKTKRSGGKKKTVIVDRSAVHIPLIALLEKITTHPDYEEMCADYICCDDPEVIDCFMKSESAKANPVLQDHPEALRIILYYDDLEVCNPLGSASGKYKLGVFYILLENIGPCHRSNLQLIGLYVIVHSDLLKVESGKGLGIDTVMDEMVEEFKKLEDGVALSNGKIIYGTLIACIGDNLGIHTVAGLKEGFTAHRPCRVCMVTETQRMCFVEEDPTLLRTDAQWQNQVSQINESRTKKRKDELMTEFGIKRMTVLAKLKSFRVTSGFPADLVHDILEGGSISIELKCILNHVLKTYQNVSLFMINERIKEFDFGHAEKKNKPAIIKKEHLDEDGHLRQKASQMWELATILPFVLAPYVSKDDENWDNFMLLLEICRMIFSDCIKKDMLEYLKDCISIYLTNFQSFYDLHLTPKQHYLTHYPSLILKYGPLVNFWTMRTEAKHKWFKRLVYILGCYKNIPLTLGEKHQYNQALVFSQPLIKPNSYGPVSKVKICDASYGELFPNVESVLEAKWMSVKGIMFKPNESYVPVGYKEDENEPQFLKVLHTLAWPEILVCTRVKTLEYDCQVGAYPVELKNELVKLHPRDIIGHRVVHAHYVVDGKMCIASKVCFGSSF